MNYDIPEIQSKWIPEIGNEVRDEQGSVMFVTDVLDKGNLEITGVYYGSCRNKKDLIFIPSIEWFLEQMRMKTGNKLLSLFERFNDDSEYKYWMTTLSMPNKECICRIFMYYKGKIYKNGEWIDGIKDSLKLCPKCCLDIKKCECSNKEKF